MFWRTSVRCGHGAVSLGLTPTSSMRWSIWWLVVSAGQSLLPKGFVAVSQQPLSQSSHSLRKAFNPFLNHRGGRTIGQVSRASLETDPTVDTATAVQEEPLLRASGIRVTDSGTKILADAPDFTKPDRDLHEYRLIKLPNNLIALLVSTSTGGSDDDEEEKSAKVEAASVHVQAGHFDDTVAGISHFNEHMLFLGTDRYPGEDDYESFLAKYGGFGNAYTDMEDTNYYFSVSTQETETSKTSEALAGGLDRLAQFFISPKFEPSMVERELRAIDSEYRNAKTSDAWRNYQFLKAVCNQSHPFSNFGCGNYETLTSKGSPIGELKKFWNDWYKTNNIRLAVVGRSSLDALQATVEKTFGQLPYSEEASRRNKVNPNSPVFPREHAVWGNSNAAFGPQQLGKIREIIPLLETRTLKIMFATPPMDDPVLRKSNPHRVVSHLLGHESPGSLHAMLNDLGYLNGLSSGIGIDTSDFSLFSVTISLTPKGMKEKETVLDLVFQWLALIKQTAYEQPELLTKFHDEIRQIAANNFKFRENGDPTDFCSWAAAKLFDEMENPGDLLADDYRYGDFDPVVTKAFLDRFRPENSMITIVDSGLTQEKPEEWQVEPLYGAVYRVSEMSPEQMVQWESPPEIDSRLHVPALNGYIPTNFSLRCDDDANSAILSPAELAGLKKEYPSLLTEKNNFRMWHKMDRRWRVPKTYIRLSIVSPVTYQSPRSMTLSRIYQRVLNDDLNSFVYDAGLAGCHYRVSCTPTGYKVSIRGFSEKLSFLLDTLTTRMLSLVEELKEGKDAHPALFDKFLKAKESLLRETRNYRLDTPYEVAQYNSRLLMEENVWYIDNYVAEMEGEDAERDPLTMEECGRLTEQGLTGRIKADALCFGNIDEKGANEVAEVLNEHFLKRARPLNDAEVPSFRSFKLPTRKEAIEIFGPDITKKSIPVKYQELAFSSSEENNAVEVTFQTGCDETLGYESVGILDLIAHLAYNSVYNQLRTQEQLGYIVSAYTRKTAGGTWGLTAVVQSSSASPEILEERIEAWLVTFRQQLQEMDPERIAMEANGVVAQLLEGPTKMSQEVGSVWNEIVATESCHERITTPAFDRLERLADELILKKGDDGLSDTTMSGKQRKTPELLKERILEFFDQFLALDAPERRGMLSRVYNQNSKEAYEASLHEPGVLSSYTDMRYLKQFLSSWPMAPYWRKLKQKET